VKEEIRIGDYILGPGHPCFVIAEAGVNHNGKMELAERLVDAAAGAGANAVKFQSFKAQTLATPNAPKAEYQKRGAGASESQYDMLKRLELSEEAHRRLMDYCAKSGVLFLSSPFDTESAAFLDSLGVAAFKIPSGEITNIPYLTSLAERKKPIILSTGMAYLGEVETAIRTIRDAGNDDIVLLHCVSNYPAEADEVNLRAMRTLAAAFHVPVGYSDHTIGVEVPLAAVALGACVIEKHLTLDRTLPGPDHAASQEPEQLARMVRGIRMVEAALGHGRKEPSTRELDTARVARKSLVAAEHIPAGAIISERHIAIKRPGTGLPPALLPLLIGRRARRAIDEGALFSWEMLE
jgi:N,N'-diacetyllegionaminate synthase